VKPHKVRYYLERRDPDFAQKMAQVLCVYRQVKILKKLIADKFGANFGVTAVGKLLAKLGLTPQKPLKRAYERDPAAIEAWKSDTYPSLAKRAKKRGAEIYFWDESGFRAM
jgi:transposase